MSAAESPSGSRHPEVVDRAADGQPAEVAARKDAGGDHVAVDGQRDVVHHRAILEPGQHRIVESRQNMLFNQLPRQPAASAVSEQDHRSLSAR